MTRKIKLQPPGMVAKKQKNVCPERDSNSYILTEATPSRWCVYQFRHPGIGYNLLILRLL